MNKWQPVVGKSPTKRELANWTEAHYIHFLRFCEFFIHYTEKGEPKVSVTKERWHKAEDLLNMPDHPFHEFLYRINHFSIDPNSSEKKFYFKLISMMKFVLGYLRSNPALVGDEMKKIIEPNARFNWCLTQTRVVDTAVGPVVVPDSQMRVGEFHNNQPLATTEQNLLSAMNRAINLFNVVAESITPEEIKKMAPKDKLLAMARMFPLFSVTKNFKPGKQIFKQINIHAAGREELESAMLAMNKDDE